MSIAAVRARVRQSCSADASKNELAAVKGDIVVVLGNGLSFLLLICSSRWRMSRRRYCLRLCAFASSA